MLGIILICYKNPEEVATFIQSELSKVNSNYIITIIDNSCTDEVFVNLLKLTNAQNASNSEPIKNGNIYAINANKNLGFARANNLGARFLIEKFSVSHLLFSNTDIEFKDNHVVDRLLQHFKFKNRIKLIGPNVVGINGKSQSPHRYLSFFRRYIVRRLFRPIHFLLPKSYYLIDKIENADPGFYYRIMGCFMLIERDIFEKIGMFDESTFLYGEEKILAERLLKVNHQAYYDPSVTIIHRESETVGTTYTEYKKYLQIFESDYIYYSKYKDIPKPILYLGKLSIFVHFKIWLPFLSLKNVRKQ